MENRTRNNLYIWQIEGWPKFTWNADSLLPLTASVNNKIGQLSGQMAMLGFENINKAHLETLTADLLSSAEIEGVILNPKSVRSSVARKLGIQILEDEIVTDHYVDGLIDIMLDAVGSQDKKLTDDRLFGWHSALLPYGRSGMRPIKVAGWREGDQPMQVVSGAMGKERIHFEAPSSDSVAQEMQQYINWVNTTEIEPVIKSAIAHLWFLTIHPFDDGNGRIGRTIADMILSDAYSGSRRYFSVSSEILHEKRKYYEILEQTQKGGLDITHWLEWYLGLVDRAVDRSNNVLRRTIQKAAYWERFRDIEINERQRKVINRLWDGFEGKLTTVKYAKMCHVGRDTALRDIQSLIENGMLLQSPEGGRSTNYILLGAPEVGR